MTEPRVCHATAHALVAVSVWPDDESLSVDAPLPYNTSTLLPDLVKLLLKVVLAEEYAAGSSPSPLETTVRGIQLCTYIH